jgi:hypothetical protein
MILFDCGLASFTNVFHFSLFMPAGVPTFSQSTSWPLAATKAIVPSTPIFRLAMDKLGEDIRLCLLGEEMREEEIQHTARNQDICTCQVTAQLEEIEIFEEDIVGFFPQSVFLTNPS